MTINNIFGDDNDEDYNRNTLHGRNLAFLRLFLSR